MGCKNLMAGALATLAVAGSVMQSEATVYTLANGSSVVGFDAGTSAGMNSWTINGVNQLFQQSYWFRTSSAGPEYNITAITPTPFVSQAYGPNGRQLTAIYSNSTVSVQLNFLLSSSSLNEQIGIQNLSTSSSLDFHLFRYSDFDLGSMPGGQNVQITPGSSGGYNRVSQTMPGYTHNVTLTAAANYAEASYYPNTLNSLNDGATTSFAGSPLTAGPGDVTYAFQWDYSLGALGSLQNSSATISVLQSIQVPEPSALALGVSAAALWVAARRRQTNSV